MLKSKLDSVKTYVRDHKVALAVTATAVIGTAAHCAVIHSHNEFLKEHDLFDKYYYADDES
jgi:hypothetical protein